MRGCRTASRAGRYAPDMPARARTAPPIGFLIFAAWLVPALLSGFNRYAQCIASGATGPGCPYPGAYVQ
jgi:hypothetical protein